MLACRSKRKLADWWIRSSFTFSTTDLSNSPFAQCRRESRNQTMLQCTIRSSSCPEIAVFFQKGFSDITREIVGKAVHAACLKGSWIRSSIFHTNTLVNMYARFGNVRYARQVFDTMPERNESSWNNLVAGYVKAGLHLDAFRVFVSMQSSGFGLNGYNTPSLLTAVVRSGSMFFEGIQIHGLALKNGLMYDVFVGTSLLHFYGGYGHVFDAHMLFELLPERNVVSWTSLMVNYSDAGLFDVVVDLFRKMRSEGEVCNQNTLTTVISSCAALDDEFLVLQVLGDVIKSGLDTNVSVANSLISTFGSFGRVEIARDIFDRMNERDTISWNSMLAAFAHNGLFEDTLTCFHSMRLDHRQLDESTLSTLLSAYDDSDENSRSGGGIHSLVLKMGLESDICVSNTLLTMYFKTGRYKDAELLFYNLPKKDLISWNSMMAGYVSMGKSMDALSVFKQLIFIANFVSFASALSACANAEYLDEGKRVHLLVITSGLEDDLVVGNALVTMYWKCGATQEAKKVFLSMPVKELVTWNAMIGAYAENGDVDEATKAYKMMRETGIYPNYITLIHVLGSCCCPRNLARYGMPFHAHIVSTGFESEEYVTNSLISMYANCGDLDSSESIFLSLVDPTPATWNAMVAAKSQNGLWEESLKLLLDMQRAEVGFDQFSLSAALSASANLTILEDGQHLHGLAIKLGFESYRFIANAVMDMYGKCGELDDLLKLLPGKKHRSKLAWNVLISAFARHGYFERAKVTFNEMVAHGAEPDHVTFVAILSACSHGGLVDDGLAYFSSMTSEFGVAAAVEHCVCIVDLLGRSGRLAEAEEFINKMPVLPNDFVWRTLLAACRMHGGHVELGKKAARRLLEANPSDDSAYVLYSNFCATSGRWHDVEGLRVRMESNNVRKKPACSWLSVRNKSSTLC
ncbi:pentatricopeptide repeat-containing protein At5g27110 [Andrographis paniculata]|uniref:pentatricopeptide repeat-containing protein At5g27110 n=1 Tax=Andrographis paniculata TaxID=175694 RepID=UPI0021E7D287|nr:pentatricopeptide repeat-containing protein At5g27110 [Andrographis paniculata]